jgi:hypothetical protein
MHRRRHRSIKIHRRRRRSATDQPRPLERWPHLSPRLTVSVPGARAFFLLRFKGVRARLAKPRSSGRRPTVPHPRAGGALLGAFLRGPDGLMLSRSEQEQPCTALCVARDSVQLKDQWLWHLLSPPRPAAGGPELAGAAVALPSPSKRGRQGTDGSPSKRPVVERIPIGSLPLQQRMDPATGACLGSTTARRELRIRPAC